MALFSFALVVAGVEPSDEVFDEIARVMNGDALASLSGGTLVVTVDREAACLADAVAGAVEDLERALPKSEVVSLDNDFVTVADIADRTGTNRETVRLWADAKRRQGFPPAVATVGDGTRIWDWPTVNLWLQQNGLPHDNAVLIDRRCAAVINGVLAERHPDRADGHMAELLRRRLRPNAVPNEAVVTMMLQDGIRKLLPISMTARSSEDIGWRAVRIPD